MRGGCREEALRIGLMLRTFDERGGVAVYSRNLVGTLLAIDRKNEYEIFYRSAEHRGLFSACPNVVLLATGTAMSDPSGAR